jgi:hypothetical protein
VTPNTITLSGAESYLKDVKQLQTTTVNLNGHQDTFTDSSVEVDVPEPDRYTAVPGRVSVTVEVAPEIGDHTIDGVPVQVPGQSDSAATPPTVSVTLRGPIPVLRALTATDIVATVADDGRPPGRARPAQVTVELPKNAGLEVLAVRPDSVVWKR